MHHQILSIIDNTITALDKAKDNLEHRNTILLDEKYFDHKYRNEVDIRYEDTLEFDKINMLHQPVLYWFELNTSAHNSFIRESYINYREGIKHDYANVAYRNTSSYKTTYDAESTTLYVGKVEKGFAGRLITHLGYNQSKKTAGMQLQYWYDISKLGSLTLHYMVFDNDMKYIMPSIEKQLALLKKPLIGKY